MKPAIFTSLMLVIILSASFICAAQTNNSQTSPELIAAQVENQKAQASYYQKQTASKSFWDSLETTLVSAFGTLIGAGLTLFGVRWSSNRQWKLEQEKWRYARDDENVRNVRTAAAAYAQKIAAEIQEMLWLAWIGKFQPETLQTKNIDSYNKAMKFLMTEDIIAQASLIAVDKTLHEMMKPLTMKVFNLDHRMSLVTNTFFHTQNAERIEEAKKLGGFHSEAYALYEGLPEALGSIFEEKFSINR